MSTLVLCTCSTELNLLLKNSRISNDGVFAIYGLERDNVNIGQTSILLNEMHQIATLPFEVKRIIFVGSPSVDQFRETIFQTLNHAVSSIYVFYQNRLTLISDHFSNQRRKRKTVFLIYPGKLFPIRNGSAMRCFDIAVSLCAKTDLTILIPSSVNIPKKFRTLLYAMGISFQSYQTNLIARIQNKVLTFLLRSIRRKNDYLPTFIRLLACKMSNKDIHSINKMNPDVLICSYIWTYDKRFQIEKLFVDTHDVMQDRAASILTNSAFDRWLLNKEKETENAILESGKSFVAISKKDYNRFRELSRTSKLKYAPPSFKWISPIAKTENSNLRVGFFGGRMQANVEALNVSLQQLKEIGFFLAGGTFVVAGDVARFIDSSEPNIIKLGYVKSPEMFYKFVDVVFAPITVKGGLNFKIFEALAAQRPVITNNIGAEEFKFHSTSKNLYISETTTELKDAIETIFRIQLKPSQSL
ncbi:glycosyltransferase [Roseibium sp. FZY0029]|uniref:glycosyltransferase n=1 Tax=Roseibium sp. FZY0029 TaxID=3116647 RepID=UPI002EC34E18|nr:glycosyltransferase [Roseibium sp. FZY0029]